MLRNTCITGAVSETLVMGYLSSQGYEVFTPMSPHSRADLVYITGDRVVRAQVKTATIARGSTSRHTYEQCRVSRTNVLAPYTSSEIDEFWVVGTSLWCFPVDFITDKTMLALGSTNPAPRKSVRGYNPDDFIVVKGSQSFPFKDRLSQDDERWNPYTTALEYTHLTSERMARERKRLAR